MLRERGMCFMCAETGDEYRGRQACVCVCIRNGMCVEKLGGRVE